MERLEILHEVKKYQDECAELLNEEWKRSKAARLHSLNKSCDNFPICLILIADINNLETLVGHSRLSKVQGKDSSCLIESVVVKKCLRGKGYGKKIMLASEMFAKGRGFKTMYLSTHDKQDFYKHIGYTFCEPIVSFGINTENLPEAFMQKFVIPGMNKSVNKTEESCEVPRKSDDSSTTTKSSFVTLSPENKHSGDSDIRTSIAMPTSPPPPPPPPPSLQKKDSRPDIVRWDPNAISWMKKELTA